MLVFFRLFYLCNLFLRLEGCLLLEKKVETVAGAIAREIWPATSDYAIFGFMKKFELQYLVIILKTIAKIC